MGDMLIRNIPEALKRDIEQEAKYSGRSLSAKAIDLLRAGISAERDAKPGSQVSAWQALRSVFLAHGPLDDEYSKIMDEVEAERKKEFGRIVEHPLDDPE